MKTESIIKQFITTLVLMALFLRFVPISTIEVKQPARVLTPEVSQGEMFLYEIDYCKKTKKTPQVTLTIVSTDPTQTINYTEKTYNHYLPQGCQVMISGMEIPPIPSGEYYLQFDLEFDITPLQRKHHSYYTDRFIVQ